MKALDVDAVERDLKALMTDSQPFWPADHGHYGGLLIRLAWHCSGSYRSWDGRGGCNGARIRFNPELSWDDNTNLDKARKLLEPIKAKYGDALTWGDLIVLAGNVAIESMGGPNIGVCLGRIDDPDGSASLPLGPTPQQELIAPCTKGDGMCEQPLGQTTMGLIYVNPEGVNGVPIPQNSVAHIRGTFGRMGMNDQETVALIGGGHAFGKTHGACPTGAGPGPKKSPDNPWPGTCGSGDLKGKGPNTFTSGFEGAWTTSPTRWSNQYFTNLLEFDWEKHKGPGGHWQWRPKHKAGSNSTEPLPDIMMLTADIALLKDPSYLKWVQHYAADEAALTKDFGNAWYKLMTRSMGPVNRCLGGKKVPPSKAFQMPLPAPSGKQPDWAAVRKDILDVMSDTKARNSAFPADASNGRPFLGAQFANLAWQCASTYRATDFAGGCNGARIRFAPQKDWPGNKGLVDATIARLKPVKDAHPDLSWADLIVLAGTIAVEQAAGVKPGAGQIVGSPFEFCPGRTDAADANGTDHLSPRNYKTPMIAVKDNPVVQGLTPREAVVLAAKPRSPAQMKARGYSAGSWTTNPAQLSNEYFKVLMGLDWQNATAAGYEYRAPVTAAAALLGKATTKDMEGRLLYLTPQDIAIKQDPELAAIAKEYAADNNLFLKDFAAAWNKAMNVDRFDGPLGNVCSATS